MTERFRRRPTAGRPRPVVVAACICLAWPCARAFQVDQPGIRKRHLRGQFRAVVVVRLRELKGIPVDEDRRPGTGRDEVVRASHIAAQQLGCEGSAGRRSRGRRGRRLRDRRRRHAPRLLVRAGTYEEHSAANRDGNCRGGDRIRKSVHRMWPPGGRSPAPHLRRRGDRQEDGINRSVGHLVRHQVEPCSGDPVEVVVCSHAIRPWDWTGAASASTAARSALVA